MGLPFILVLALQGIPSPDPGLPEYRPIRTLEGKIVSIGSDTLNNLMTFWGEGLNKHHPKLTVELAAKGSRTAPPSLIAGQSQLGPMARPMKPAEEEAFIARFGYPPTRITVAVDAIGIFVNIDNPLEEILLEAADAVWSSTRRRGAGEIRFWGGLGLNGEWADRPISLYGRNSASGTYGFFKERVLLNGDFREEVREQPGGPAILLMADRSGMGFAGIGYGTSKMKALRIAPKAGEKAVAGTEASARDGSYPLARELYVYVNKPPGGPPEARVLEFLTFVMSKEGQEVVLKDGYFTLTAAMAAEQLKKLE